MAYASGDAAEAAYRATLDAAVKSLGRREHSRRELEQKLARRGHPRALVTEVLDYLSEHDLQSDARYAEDFVRSRVARGYGPVKIRQELATRGVREPELESQLTEPAEFWLEVATSALAKRFGAEPWSCLEDTDDCPDASADASRVDGYDARRQDWNARARFLARRGFPADLIYRVLGAERG
jgi:regulatory protein